MGPKPYWLVGSGDNLVLGGMGACRWWLVGTGGTLKIFHMVVCSEVWGPEDGGWRELGGTHNIVGS